MSQRARIRKEGEEMLGPNAREAWQDQEHREQTAAGLEYEAEFRRKSPKTKKAWDNQAYQEEFHAAQQGEAEFRRKSPSAKQAWDSVGRNVNAKPFVPIGGKRKYYTAKHRKAHRNTKGRKPKRTAKKRVSQRKGRKHRRN